jgi:hypothetical protein
MAVGGDRLDWRRFPRFLESEAMLGPRGLFDDSLVDDRMLEACLNLDERVTRIPCRSKPPAFVDGYLDEWEDREFAMTPRGRFAVRCRREGYVYQWWNYHDTHWLAMEMTDPDIAARIAAEGAEDHIDLVLADGARAGFVEHLREDRYLWRGRMRPGGGEKRRMAYSVAPDGRSCMIEIAVYCKQLMRPRKANEKPHPSEVFYGDIAVRALWRSSEWDRPVNLLDEPIDGALSFSRAVVEYE